MTLAEAIKELKALVDLYAQTKPELAEAYDRAARLLRLVSNASPLSKGSDERHPNVDFSVSLEVPTVQCKRCRYEWVPRRPRVFRCPHCKTPYWDIEPGGAPGLSPPSRPPLRIKTSKKKPKS